MNVVCTSGYFKKKILSLNFKLFVRLKKQLYYATIFFEYFSVFARTIKMTTCIYVPANTVSVKLYFP